MIEEELRRTYYMLVNIKEYEKSQDQNVFKYFAEKVFTCIQLYRTGENNY
jgi:hypothetical protein